MAASNTNICIIQGRLVRDPEARGGGKVAAFTIASNRFFYQNGERQEERCFQDCVAFGYEAEAILQHLTKGSPAQVEGRMVTNQWTTDDGDNRSRNVLNVRYTTSPVFAKARQNGAVSKGEPVEDAELVGVGAPQSDDDIPF